MVFSVLILDRADEEVTFKQPYSGQEQKMGKGVKPFSLFPSEPKKKYILDQTNISLHKVS